MRITIMSHDPDPGVLPRITVCQRNKDHWLGSCVRITYNKNPALTIAPKI
ncbi:hypothetical protein HanPSC8_Chr17g0775751 [Helianthus annuus]|nr:hypothetical protein HanPSC8_Chr17g0775751 [Helianthus annuus]